MTEAFRVSADVLDGEGRRTSLSFIVRSGAGWKRAAEQAHMQLEGVIVTGGVAVDEIYPPADEQPVPEGSRP